MNHETCMKMALEEAKCAFDEGEIPVGAVLVLSNNQIIRARNSRQSSKNPLFHAEIRLLYEAAQIQNDWRLTGSTLYVTLEPCPMCLGALLQARITHLVYGALDPKRTHLNFLTGDQTLIWPSLENVKSIEGNNHKIQMTGGILSKDCSELLTEFFKQKRARV